MPNPIGEDFLTDFGDLGVVELADEQDFLMGISPGLGWPGGANPIGEDFFRFFGKPWAVLILLVGGVINWRFGLTPSSD